MQLQDVRKIAQYQEENWNTVDGYITSYDVLQGEIAIGGMYFSTNSLAEKQTFNRLKMVGTSKDFSEPQDIDILQEAVNYCIRVKQKTKSRVIYDINTNDAKAVMSNRYTPVGNLKVLDSALDKYEDSYHAGKSYIDDHRMYISFGNIKTLDIKSKKDPQVGDIIGLGSQIWNSDVGLSSLGVGQFMICLRCTNGMTGKDEINVARISHSSNNLMEKLAIGMKKILDPKRITKVIQRAIDRPALLEEFDDFPKIVKGIPQRHHEGIKQAYKDEPVITSDGINGWTIYNAVTRYNTHIYPQQDNYNRYESQQLMGKAYPLLTV